MNLIYRPITFFDSAKESNGFESVSERIAKAFLIDILKIKNIARGDAEAHEPDYVSSGKGYEVTFAVEQSLIPQLKGVRPLDTKSRNIEDELISDISNAASRKAGKTYSCTPSLVIIAVETLPTWYYPLFIRDTDPLSQMAWRIHTRKHNAFFESLYNDYIQAGILKTFILFSRLITASLLYLT